MMAWLDFMTPFPSRLIAPYLVGIVLGILAWIARSVAARYPHNPGLRHSLLSAVVAASLVVPPILVFGHVTGFELVTVPVSASANPLLPPPSSPRATEDDALASSFPIPPPLYLPPPGSTSEANPSGPILRPAVPGNVPPASPEVVRAWSWPRLEEILAAGLAAWALGVLLLLGRLVFGVFRLRRIRNQAREACSPALAAIAEDVAQRLRLPWVPTVRASSTVAAPLAAGCGRAMVVLPASLLESIDPEKIRYILIHEFAHIQRQDHVFIPFQLLAGVLYWPIPPVHGLIRDLASAREELCDQEVLQHGDALHYGEALLQVAEFAHGSRLPRVCVGMAQSRGELVRRIERLLEPGRSLRTCPSRSLVASIMILAMAAGTLASTTRLQTTPPFAGSPSSSPANPAQANVAPDHSPAPGIAIATARFQGLVVDAEGQPLANARLFVVPTDTARAPGPVRAMSDDAGRFSFEAPDMTTAALDGSPISRMCLLIATADGFAPGWIVTYGEIRNASESRKAQVKERENVLHVAPDDIPLRGRLLDFHGKPLAHATVRLSGLMIPVGYDLDAHLQRERQASLFFSGDYERSIYDVSVLPGVEHETRTNAEGEFLLNGLGRDRLAHLKVTHPSVQTTSIVAMTREAPDVPVRLDFNQKPTQTIHGSGFTLNLVPGRTITGVVRDQATGEPLAGLGIGRSSATMDDDSMSGILATTDQEGRFAIHGLHPNDELTHLALLPPAGSPYPAIIARVDGRDDLEIDCPRGIPFRLQVVDEQDQLVEAEVTSRLVTPHTITTGVGKSIVSRAARQPDGTYQGVVLPGPGAILVKAASPDAYRAAHVDPKAFFAPGRTDWTSQDLISTFGTQDTLQVNGGVWVNQHDYEAIVLVNPTVDSPPLDLKAVLLADQPRMVTVLDPDGHPLSGVKTIGLSFHPWDREPALRSASFPLRRLHPDRPQRITFVHPERKLVGFLLARGDGDSPYTVQVRPWGTLTGRIVDENGEPFPAATSRSSVAELWMGNSGIVTNPDPAQGVHATVRSEPDGRFVIDQLVPGQAYRAEMYRGIGRFSGMAFEGVILDAGETRDLGDIRAQPPVEFRGR